jgi:hypothetical protein
MMAAYVAGNKNINPFFAKAKKNEASSSLTHHLPRKSLSQRLPPSPLNKDAGSALTTVRGLFTHAP